MKTKNKPPSQFWLLHRASQTNSSITVCATQQYRQCFSEMLRTLEKTKAAVSCIYHLSSIIYHLSSGMSTKQNWKQKATPVLFTNSGFRRHTCWRKWQTIQHSSTHSVVKRGTLHNVSCEEGNFAQRHYAQCGNEGNFAQRHYAQCGNEGNFAQRHYAPCGNEGDFAQRHYAPCGEGILNLNNRHSTDIGDTWNVDNTQQHTQRWRGGFGQ